MNTILDLVAVAGITCMAFLVVIGTPLLLAVTIKALLS